MSKYDGKTGEVQRWADTAMYEAVPTGAEDGGAPDGVRPAVTLLYMTPDPLGAIAAASEMYRGNPVRSYNDITEEQRTFFWEDIKKTRLNSPYEFVDLHFLFEGVTRAFTHQLVRQRVGAVYVQESQRFAVKSNGAHEVQLPPSLLGLKDDDPRRVAWESAVQRTADSYMALVNAGIPAEDARGLLPTNITTRIHYKTNLRALVEHAGNRLCTQAQFEWRYVWLGIVAAIRAISLDARTDVFPEEQDRVLDESNGYSHVWRANEVADLFRPICYQTGRCQFQAKLDRHCKIRDRVDENAAIGRSSAEWNTSTTYDASGRVHTLLPIMPAEWMLDHTSARLAPDAAAAATPKE